MIEENLNIINLFCRVDEIEGNFIIEKDESYRSKQFLVPTNYFIIFCAVYLYTSITIFFVFRSSLSVNVLCIPLICYLGCYWFFMKYLFYKGRFIRVRLNTIAQVISFRQVFPCIEQLQKFHISDISSIIVKTDYLNPGRKQLIFNLKNKKELEFFDGNSDECEILGKKISQEFNVPLIFKANINKTFIVSNFIFFFMLITSILFNDVIGQIFFLFGFIISYAMNFSSLAKTYYKTS